MEWPTLPLPTRRHARTVVAMVLLTVLAPVVAAGPAGAHTATDLVAVPAGGQATVALEPMHGCGTSPTVAVSIRAPVRGATPGEVEGWTATALEDEDGTVLEWSGGVLAADESGRFPVAFPVPEETGRLLLFPAVQSCQDGQELTWISGDPAAEYPAPRVLVLPAGSPPAATLDDVPADAPGRDQLVQIVDTDAPEQATTSTTAAGGASPDTRVPSGSSDGTATEEAAAVADEGGGGGGVIAIAVGVVVVAALAIAAFVLLRQRSQRAG